MHDDSVQKFRAIRERHREKLPKHSEEHIEQAQSRLLDEGLEHLSSACLNIERVRARAPDLSKGFTTVSDAAMSAALQHLAIHLGQASLTLFDCSERRRSEDKCAYELRKSRAMTIAEFLADIDLSPLSDRRVRNRLIHVDEYMGSCGAMGEGVWLSNISLSHREAVKSKLPMHYCRVYIFAEDRLLHLGAEMDVKAAYDAGMTVLGRFGWELNRDAL